MKKVMRAIGPIVCLAYCSGCKRVEWMRNGGPFTYQCDECLGVVGKVLK